MHRLLLGLFEVHKDNFLEIDIFILHNIPDWISPLVSVLINLLNILNVVYSSNSQNMFLSYRLSSTTKLQTNFLLNKLGQSLDGFNNSLKFELSLFMLFLVRFGFLKRVNSDETPDRIVESYNKSLCLLSLTPFQTPEKGNYSSRQSSNETKIEFHKTNA